MNSKLIVLPLRTLPLSDCQTSGWNQPITVVNFDHISSAIKIKSLLPHQYKKPPEDKNRAKHWNYGKWQDAVHVYNSHGECKGIRDPLVGTMSLFPPNPGSHTFTGPCVWVWCHPAAEAFLLFVVKCAPFMQLVSRVTGHIERGGSVNTSNKRTKRILGIASKIDFCLISVSLFNVGC